MTSVSIEQAFARALQLHQAGRLEDAETLYRQILAVQPGNFDALHHLGVIAGQVGRNDLAVEWIRRAITIHPGDPAAHGNLGEIYRTIGRLDEAIASLRRALEIKPDFLEAVNNLGLALLYGEDQEEAAAQFRRALELRPDYAIAHYNLGLALAKQRHFCEAIAAYRRALQLNADYAEAWSNLGGALFETGQPDEAIAAYRRALHLKAGFADAHNNLGTALNDQGHYDEAMAEYCQALRCQPDHRCAEYNRALLLLLRGDFEHGWASMEARWAALEYAPQPFPQPRWNGGGLDGRRVLLHAEQGLGDSIQFIRYASLVVERGGEVIVECQTPLVELFRTAKGVSQVLAAGDTLPPFDTHVPMPSLPLALQTTAESIPREVPYLFANPARCEAWHARIGGDPSRLKVGLVWSGNPQQKRLRKRHVALKKLLPLWPVPGVDFYSLQTGPGAKQLQQLSGEAGLVDLTEHIHDFADTAAFLMELDLIISVDTAAAHLAGALARPVWTVLPFVPDWRWGLGSETTPWYPTMRLFRQPRPGDWDAVIQRVVEELKTLNRGWRGGRE